MEHTNNFKIQTKKRNILRQNKGAALAWVLIVFVMLSILVGSIAFISSQNIFEVAKQEERLQTYYIALSGIDLTHAALMDINGENIGRSIDAEIIGKIKTGPMTEDIDIKVEIDGEIKKIGTAFVTIDRVTTTEDTKDIDWLRITSIGQLEGKNTKVKSIMRINEKNYNMIVREN